VDKLFKALNDPTRRGILVLLRKQDMNAGEIAERFNISKPSISHHLDLLKQADLVLAEKNGQFVNYSLNTSVLDECLAWLLDLKNKKNKTGA
jgi:DNA-binding transcriptional ArsR family regulator